MTKRLQMKVVVTADTPAELLERLEAVCGDYRESMTTSGCGTISGAESSARWSVQEETGLIITIVSGPESGSPVYSGFGGVAPSATASAIRKHPPMAGGQDDTLQLPGLHEVRPEVAAMARLMEYQLRKHDDRPGWKSGVAGGEAVQWLREEVPVLARAVEHLEFLISGTATPEEVAKAGFKAANVANYALMAASICGALEIPVEPEDLPDGEYDIIGWCQRMIEGGGGMNVYEQRELATWPKGERVGAAEWIIRCLGNPRCDGSADVLQAIIYNRQQVMAKKGPAWWDRLPELLAQDRIFAGEFIAQIENAARRPEPDTPEKL